MKPDRVVPQELYLGAFVLAVGLLLVIQFALTPMSRPQPQPQNPQERAERER